MLSQIYLNSLSAQTLSVLKAANGSDSTLLITGSTGTGKSYLAHSVHKASARSQKGRWYKINLATLSENLIESELFGHERGAFTGAESKRLGKLEICNGGTIFLDEIGELPIRLQAKLLDFIQYKRISPVGGNREIELDVRIIAATNKNLEAAVRAGEFRADLFHRLNVFHVRLPDLALNPRGVMELAAAFLARQSNQTSKKFTGFSRVVEQLFKRYPWPGNIRELENAVEFAVAMQAGGDVELGSLPQNLQAYAASHNLEGGSDCAPPAVAEVPHLKAKSAAEAVAFLELPVTLDFHESKEAFEKAYLCEALRLCGGQINLTSRRIGLNKVSLTDKIKRYAIDWRKIRYDALGPAMRPLSRESAARTSPSESAVIQS